MGRTRLRAAATLAVAAALLACGDPAGRACTEIGCSDGLYVELQGTPGAALEVVASTLSAEERSAGCIVPPAGSCVVAFDGFVPQEVTLAVLGGDRPVSVTVEPAYEDLQPNGPGCPPICRQATVEVDLEAGSRHSWHTPS